MPITQARCNSFKVELLQGIHDFSNGGDVIMAALYTSAATLNKNTTVYSPTNEVVGTGYTAGGVALTNVTPALDGDVAIVDFNDPIWSNSTITARGMLLYNASKLNRAIAVIDFGGDITTASADFVGVMPAAAGATAILRIS